MNNYVEKIQYDFIVIRFAFEEIEYKFRQVARALNIIFGTRGVRWGNHSGFI